jgi:ribonuclease HII
MAMMASKGLVGVDETGRGSLFGPVVTCAVAFPLGGLPAALARSLADSKALSARERERVAADLTPLVPHAFGAASAAEVDLLNPLRATMVAMARAVRRLGPPVGSEVVVDGPHAPALALPTKAMVRADSQVAEVMAASILAKVFRDRLVASLSARHPGYGLERHAGYGTRAHAEALATLGPTRHHRLTFLRRICADRSITGLSGEPATNRAWRGSLPVTPLSAR